MPSRFLIRALRLLLVSAPAGEAHAQGAHATEAELPGEGVPHLLEVALGGELSRVFDPSRVAGVSTLGAFELRSRLELGHAAAYGLGIAGTIGGTNHGAVYELTGYPVGFGTIWGDGNTVLLCGGVGVHAIGAAVPLAARLPVELRVAVNLGPLRPALWARPSFVPGLAARKDGSSLPLFDELEAGLSIRLSPEHHYWGTAHGGGGLYVGTSYTELMHTRTLGLLLGFDFSGGR